jgi:hypothetical protein
MAGLILGENFFTGTGLPLDSHDPAGFRFWLASAIGLCRSGFSSIADGTDALGSHTLTRYATAAGRTASG